MSIGYRILLFFFHLQLDVCREGNKFGVSDAFANLLTTAFDQNLREDFRLFTGYVCAHFLG